MIDSLIEEHQISVIRACRVLSIHRSKYYYVSKKDDLDVENQIRIHSKDSNEGFWKIYYRIRNSGIIWNHKKVYRVYKSLKLNKRSKLKRRLPARIKEPLNIPTDRNITWSLDFVSDVLTNKRKFRVLNIIDDYNREAISQEVAISLPSERVLRILEQVIWCHGKPQNIRVDNGPEFISNIFRDWCQANCITIKYIQPGKPMQNSFIERFNGSYRRSLLDAYLFDALDQVRDITERWMTDYNENRPHESLGNKSPKEYLEIKNSEKLLLVS